MAQKKEYTASQKVLEAEAAVERQKAKKPEGYQSAYDDALKQVMDRVLNREDFHYNLAGDALYRQYRNQAERSGRLAMEDTMGMAAALTGGSRTGSLPWRTPQVRRRPSPGATAIPMPSPWASRPTAGSWTILRIGFRSFITWP